MKKTSKPAPKKPAAKKPTAEKPAAKKSSTKPKRKAGRQAELAAVVEHLADIADKLAETADQLVQSAERLAQAAERMAEMTLRTSVTESERQDEIEKSGEVVGVMVVDEGENEIDDGEGEKE
jgi:hypothetical protein